MNCLQVLAILVVTSQGLQPDYVVEMATSNGYPIEIYRNIQTKDGYLLTLHRIPHGKSKAHLKIIFFWDPQRALVFYYLTMGYDVWLANPRSVSHSRRHVKYNPDYDREFWNFSITEVGMYDLPAKIDFIIKITKHKQLLFVGFSQGVQALIVMCSKVPEYAKKIEYMVALGPAVYIFDSPHPWLGLLTQFTGLIYNTLLSLGFLEIPPKVVQPIIRSACHVPGFDEICVGLIQAFVGINLEQFNKSYVPAMSRNLAEAVSLKQIVHLSQFIRSGRFQEYDYGRQGNLLQYGQEIPPLFNVSKMTFPVSLYSAKNDWFVRPENVQKLANDLPNVADNYLVENERFCHFDFVGANDVVPLLYNRVLKCMQNYIE